jgi:serine/threonine protein kinase
MPYRQRNDAKCSLRCEGRHPISGATAATACPYCPCDCPQQHKAHYSSPVKSLPESSTASPDILSCKRSCSSITMQPFGRLDEKERLAPISQNAGLDVLPRNLKALSSDDSIVVKEMQEDAKSGPFGDATIQPYVDMIPSLMGTWRSCFTMTNFLGSPMYQRKRIRRLPQPQHQHRPILVLLRSMAVGALLGGLVTLCFLSIWNLTNPRNFQHFSNRMEFIFPITVLPHHQQVEKRWCSFCQKNNQVRKIHDPTRQDTTSGIMSYLNLFQSRARHSSSNRTATEQGRRKRSLATSTSSSVRSSISPFNDDYKDTQLVIAGKMTVEDAPCNIAQYNLKKDKWSLMERIQLSLYNSYSGGEVYSLLANHTSTRHDQDTTKDEEGESKRYVCRSFVVCFSVQVVLVLDVALCFADKIFWRYLRPVGQVTFEGSGELIVVGAFDTTYRNSQVTYCSVGTWDGLMLSKVGEGLCNSALSKGMKITTAALAGPQDVYVAGSFQTQVWNGDRHEFVKIYNIAHYNAVDQVWLPLNIGQITCSWCTVTVLALAWDFARRQLHVAGKFNAIDGRNVPAGLAIYDLDSGHLVAHPGGGLSMQNATQDGVGTALQLDDESGVLYVMGSFERLTATGEVCYGLAAYEITNRRWTCLADSAHTVQPTGGGNMLLTPYGLMVAGKVSGNTTWVDDARPYTIAMLKATLKTHEVTQAVHGNEYVDDDYVVASGVNKRSSSPPGIPRSSRSNNTRTSTATQKESYHEFDWSWLPGFDGHDEPLHALTNGFGEHAGAVFIAGDNLVAKWSYQERKVNSAVTDHSHGRKLYAPPSSISSSQTRIMAVTENLSADHVRGSIMAISQMMPVTDAAEPGANANRVNITIIIYCVAAGCVIGMFGAIMCNRNLSASVFPCLYDQRELNGISLDTLTYSALENTNITDAYHRAMKTRYVQHPHLLTIIDPQEIFLQRIIGEGTFGRVWSARWRSSSVAVKEFVFAQAAVAGKSSMQQEIVEEIIGEAGMMAILRHPNVLQLFGCSLTAQAIWIVSELCSLGSLRQVLDDNDRSLTVNQRVHLALQVAEGMTYLHNQDPPIIHRDLKSHNIFVHETFTDAHEGERINEEQDGKNQLSRWLKPQKMTSHSTIVAKIGDWGSARATLSGSRTMTHGVGTACWLAPEVIKHARASKFSDVYGYGIILWELATREEVYQGLETTQIIAKVANESLRPPVPQDCPWKVIMVKCWAENPHDRLDFGEVVLKLNEIHETMDEEPLADVSSSSSSDSPRDEILAEETHEGSPLMKTASNGVTVTQNDQPKKKKNTGALTFGLNAISNALKNAIGDA